jgi:DNA-nicking Smr family endonuclease
MLIRLKKTLTAEDCALFRQAVGEVTAIKTERGSAAQILQKPRPSPKPRALEPSLHLRTDFSTTIETVGAEDSLSFLHEPAAKKLLKKLRQGHFPVEAHLDLHGLNSAAAKQQLLRFLQHCLDKNYRCIHVVHGKGYRSSEGHPVLKNELNQWLRNYHAVQAFCSAPQKDGGTGAVWVLLRGLKTNFG